MDEKYWLELRVPELVWYHHMLASGGRILPDRRGECSMPLQDPGMMNYEISRIMHLDSYG